MNDLIDRQQAINALIRLSGRESKNEIIDICAESEMDGLGWIGGILDSIGELEDLPSAQEIIRCKDCIHFHYDFPYVIQGIPVFVHEICDFWGDGCKTSENEFCSHAERRSDV